MDASLDPPRCILDERVLVLNNSWKPISTTTVAKALNKLINKRFKIVGEDFRLYNLEEYIENWSDAIKFAKAQEENRKILSHPSFRFPIPEVVVATEYNGFHATLYKVKFSRRNIFLRDRNTCQYCGKTYSKENLNLEHVIPESQGGLMTWENIVLACIKCNTKKSNRTPKEAHMVLLRKPKKPTLLEMGLKLTPDGQAPKSWEDFLGKLYWNIELKD